MLTGPVTLLNWSYPRSDLSRQAQAFQLALAVRDEVADLEAAGARIVQVDEAAMREGLPLKQARREAYLDWAVRAFRLSTAVARPATQIHTHMCYSEFGDIMEALKGLDADAISIENSRSDRATLVQLAQAGYPRPVGPGVYDIHAPIVPDVEAMRAQLDACQRYLPAEQIWVNPDCGLKTRRWPEVKPALRNMVAAAQTVRETYQQSALRGKA
jgi:5-methyltetrahydropteroyltriglutamate--homocysteine methyltransferase